MVHWTADPAWSMIRRLQLRLGVVKLSPRREYVADRLPPEY